MGGFVVVVGTAEDTARCVRKGQEQIEEGETLKQRESICDNVRFACVI